MPKSSVAVPSSLRAARLAEGRGWSLRAVARKIHSNPTSLSEWERGLRPPPSDIQAALCKVYRAKPAELGFEQEQVARDGDMASDNLSRRAFLVGALATPILLGARWQAEEDITGTTLETMAALNDRYRAIQVQGLKYSREQLLRHMATIEHLLDTSIHARSRRDLYQILARVQLLARAGSTTAERLTLTERALASAQHCGDTYLQAAVYGHLGQFYTFRLDHPTIGEHYLDLAAQLARGDRLLMAWIAAQRAEAAARLGLRGKTVRHLG